MTKVKLSDLSDALMFVSSDYSAEVYLCRETGKLHWTGDEGVHDFDEIQLPDDLDDVEKYIPVPDKRDLDLGTQLVFEFIGHHLPKHYDEIRAIFRRKGAYGRFKELLYQQDRLEQWYEFSDVAEKRALLEWCKEHGLEADDDETAAQVALAMDYDIQLLTSENSELMARIGPEVFDNPIEAHQLRIFLDDERHIMFVALDSDTVIGMASALEYFHPDKQPQLWINEVGVASTHRKLGIGRSLVEALIRIAEDRGCICAWLGTDIDNKAAQACFGSVPKVAAPQPFLLYEWDL